MAMRNGAYVRKIRKDAGIKKSARFVADCKWCM